jgi:hypothetical protein
MRSIPFALALVAVGSVAGCAGKPAAVPIAGNAAGMSALSGRWEGEYHSSQTGRGGSIVFTLTAGTDSATGDVLMIPSGTNQPIMREGAGRLPSTASGAAPAVLSIRFVRVEGGKVSGALDPYRAPDCDCVVSTTFIGDLSGDRIAGTFTTRGGTSSAPVTGEWEVRRRR